MVRYPSLISISVLFLCVFSPSWAEEPAPGALEQLFFTAEIPWRATNKSLGPKLGYIATNTVAFQKYAMKAMLEHITFLNHAWELGLPKPISIEALTAFGAYPKTEGFSGGITISNRFGFRFENGKFEGFRDRRYSRLSLIPQQNLPDSQDLNALEGKREMAAEWLDRGKNLSRKEALDIASRALQRAGYDQKALKLQGPILRQERLRIKGKLRDLPLWEVSWYYNNNKDHLPVAMQVSGMTTNVVDYFNLFEKTLPMPDDYYDLLGLPDPRRKED